jgi:exopolyphosphatase/pppGpp-phosphohydrolase
MRWCKTRAHDYLPQDPRQAVLSMLSDLSKHLEMRDLAEAIGLIAFHAMRDASDAQQFIDGFAK